MIDQIFWWLGLITCVIGALCGFALLAWLAGNAWIDASRKWRLIFRAENNIIDYISITAQNLSGGNGNRRR